MFSFLKGVSKVSLAAVAGFGAAIFGAFLGWLLIPVVVSFAIDQVYKYTFTFIFDWRQANQFYRFKYLW